MTEIAFVVGPHGARDEARPPLVVERRARLPRDPRGIAVDLAGAILETVLRQHEGRRAEGVGLDDVAAGLEVRARAGVARRRVA